MINEFNKWIDLAYRKNEPKSNNKKQKSLRVYLHKAKSDQRLKQEIFSRISGLAVHEIAI